MEGLSQELSKKIVNEYKDFIVLNTDGEYQIDKKILDNFNENDILKVELEYFIC